MAAKYQNYWQRLLQDEAEAKAAGGESPLFAQTDAPVSPAAPAPPVGDFTYDISLLPEPAPTYSPRLGYDVESLDEPLAGPGAGGYRDDEIVVNGRRSQATPSSGKYPERTVGAQCDGRIMPGMTGWQNANQHHGKGAGMGWRTWVQCSDGSGRIGYGHMDSSTTLRDGTAVKVGQPIGRYADPTNGHTDGGPHVHVQQMDARGRIIRPTVGSPLMRPSRMTSPFRAKTGIHSGPGYKNGHQGEDWSDK